jgi:hypothetical protein
MEPVLAIILFGMFFPACSITLGHLQRADAAEEKALTPEVLARFRKDHGREPSSTELMYAVQERQCEWRRERRAEKKARRKAAKTA